MLIVANSLKDFCFAELMEVYEQSNLEAAAERKNLPAMFALQLAEQDFRQYLQEVFFQTTGAVYYIWEDDARYVSALRLEPYRDGMLLEALETSPTHRQKGYAVTLLQEVQNHIKHHGVFKIYSHVNKRNDASIKVHKKCGFRIISDCAHYINGSVDYRCYTLLYECEKTLHR